MNLELGILLQYSIFKKYNYLSGEESCHNRVKSVVILDSKESMLNLAKDALVFISDAALIRDDCILQSIVEKQVSAVVVKEKNAVSIKKKWMKLVHDADYPIALLSFPNEFPVMSFTRLHLFYVEDLFNNFRKVLTESGIEGLVKMLHESSELQTAAFFGHNRYEEPTPFLPEDFYETKKTWQQLPVVMDFQDVHFSKNFECYRYDIDEENSFVWLYLELHYKNILVGQIGFWNAKNEFEKDHYMLLETGCKMCEDELRRVYTTRDKEEQKKGIFLEEILGGKIENNKDIRNRALEFDWQIGETFQPLEIDIMSEEEYVDSNIIQLVKRHFSNQFIDQLPIAIYRKSIVALLPGDKLLSVERLEALNRMLTKSYPSLRFYLGTGKVHVLEELKRGMEEARYAVERAIADGNSTTCFNDLGYLKLIGYRYANEEMSSFSDQYLGDIKAFDREHSTELLKTLALFLSTGLNYKQTAEKLFLHHNTVRYRIKLIGDITGSDLQQINDLVNLTIALKLDGLI
jgi:sugar diacid utilization regulator